MTSVRVSIPGNAPEAYEVRIVPGGLRSVADDLPRVCPAHRYAIIADSTVAGLYGTSLLEALRGAGANAELLEFPAGEENKNREVWAELTDRMLAAGFGRDAAVLALGGGVTGDLAGFVAASYLRGLPLVHLPTSLLAMIDSSVGGKTGVDTPAGKNLVGAFLQPRVVIADPETLGTLPPAHIRSGLAEAVKHGVIADAEYFEWIAANAGPLVQGDPAVMVPLIRRSVEIKAQVVETDEREGGLRKTLNFGHTIGHAVEALSDYALLHGEAIAIGMVAEATLGEVLGLTERGSADRIRTLLEQIGLPTKIPAGHGAEDILDFTRRDKKGRGGKVEYAMIERIGTASVGTGRYGMPVEDATVRSVVQ